MSNSERIYLESNFMIVLLNGVIRDHENKCLCHEHCMTLLIAEDDLTP